MEGFNSATFKAAIIEQHLRGEATMQLESSGF